MTHTLEFVLRHGYSLLFFWVLAEQADLPIPSGPLLLACGALARSGRMSPHLIALTGLAACLIADNFWFIVGRRRGSKVLRLICRLSLEPDSCVRQTETRFLRYGVRSLLVSKFVPGLSAVSAPLSAISGVRWRKFLLYDTAGSLIWLAAYAGVGYIFSGQLDLIADYAARMGSWVALVVLGLLAAWIGWKYYQRQRFLKKLTVDRITATELREKLQSGEPLVVVDVRSVFEMDDSIPGALHIPLEELDARHADIPRDRDVVLFCSCPNEASSARAALLLRKRGIVRVHPLYGGVDAWRALEQASSRLSGE